MSFFTNVSFVMYIWRITPNAMKLTILMLLTGIMQLHAEVYSQTTFNFNKPNTTVKEMFHEIEGNSNYTIFYRRDYIDLKKNIKVFSRDQSIHDLMKQVLHDQPLTFELIDNVIVIKTLIQKNTPDLIVNGKVVSATGEPMQGVSVKLKGTPIGVSTDAEGKYSIQIPENNGTLIFSYVGYTPQEVEVNGRESLDIQLTESVKGLDEVIVVGYGTQKKVSLTGAVSSINGARLTTTKNESVTNMLTGKLPGVRIVQKSAEPGTFNSTFDIRGLGSPLVIIDGVPRSNYQRLDPNDIESISILKDATAAVYGVQSANGVVLITTKKGKAGSSELRYEITAGLQRSSGNPDVAGAVDWMTLRNEQAFRTLDGPLVPAYSVADIDEYRNGTKQSTNWYPYALRRNSPQTQHNLTALGGSDKVTYYLSLGHFSQGGFWKSGDLEYKKYNFRSNVTAKISPSINATLQVMGISDLQEMPYGVNGQNYEIFKTLWRVAPIYPIYANNDPSLPTYISDAFNPMAVTSSNSSGYQLNKRDIFQGNFNLEYTVPFIQGLRVKGFFSYDVDSRDAKQYIKTYTLYNQLSPTVAAPVITNSPASVTRNYENTTNMMTQFSLDYAKTIGKNRVEALLLYEERTQKGDNFSALRQLAITTLDQLGTGNAINQIANQDLNGLFTYATKSVVAKLHYDYEGKYLADITGRYDGSSRFSGNKQWGLFPSIGLGWRISEEGFMKNWDALSFINNLKIRGSYGVLGDASGLAFQFLTGYNFPGNGRIGGDGDNGHAYGGGNGNIPPGTVFGGNFITGVGFRSLANANITWFESKTMNIGADADMWNGLLGVHFDIFRRDRTGLLANRLLSLPGSLGASLPQENLNSDRAQGFELELTHTNTVGSGINYYVNGNISYARTMNGYSDRAASGNQYANWRDNPVNRYQGIFWGNEPTGQYMTLLRDNSQYE